jgi:hypothetical protein
MLNLTNVGRAAPLTIAALLIVVLSNAAFAAPTNVLWYSGDPTGGDWVNAATNVDDIRHWQPFTVTDALGWTVDTVYSVGDSFGNANAEWSIRSGMSVGNPGTALFSGTGPIIASPLAGKTANEILIPDVFLAPGTYWLEVATIGDGGTGGGGITATDGTNSVGTTPALDSIRNWPNQNQYYQTYSDPILSSGVTGAVVPEPATLALLGLGGLLLRKRK